MIVSVESPESKLAGWKTHSCSAVKGSACAAPSSAVHDGTRHVLRMARQRTGSGAIAVDGLIFISGFDDPQRYFPNKYPPLLYRISSPPSRQRA
jgi:hypothetical protein